MAEHTALIQFPPPWRVYLITQGPGLPGTIIYSELDLEASGLETGKQEQKWKWNSLCLPIAAASS